VESGLQIHDVLQLKPLLAAITLEPQFIALEVEALDSADSSRMLIWFEEPL
jgi:hypothetical protein